MEIIGFEVVYEDNIVGIQCGITGIDDKSEVIGLMGDISDSHGVITQIFDADHIAGREQLIHASRLALRNIANEENFADSPSIELACWVAGTRQINRALKRVGISEDTRNIALTVIGSNNNEVEKGINELSKKILMKEDEEVLNINSEKEKLLIKLYSISNTQLKTAKLKDLILEKIALLNIKK